VTFFMKEEGRKVFDYRRIAEIVKLIKSGYDGKVMGYQFGLMQSGRFIHLSAYGYTNKSKNKKMTTRTHHSTGSVSKMVTAATVLKMVDDGILNYNDRFTQHIPIPKTKPHSTYLYLPSDKLIDPTSADVRLIELLTYTARFGSPVTSEAIWKAPRSTTSCNTTTYTDSTWTFNPSNNLRCNVGYQNSAMGILGYVIASKTGINLANVTSGNTFYQTYTRNLWLKDAYAGDMICGEAGDKYYDYTGCNSGSDCFNGYKQIDPGTDPETTICGMARWKSSTESMLQMMAAFRPGRCQR
jgi:CubicO group peptidase (beta-lactamase class C family)